MKKAIKNIAYKLKYATIRRRWISSHIYEMNKICDTAGLCIKPAEGEGEFRRKWAPLTDSPNLTIYRVYSQFIGPDPNILPDDLFHYLIDPLLNDKCSLPVYLNKNMYEKLIGSDKFPVCVLRNMYGDYMTCDYKDIAMNECLFDKMVLNNEHLCTLGKLIIKPSVETGRGKGVRLFCYDNGCWTSDDNKILSLEFLNEEYHSDFIIQEVIEPSDFVKQFNPTSYSTFRIYTYRSVVDGSIKFLGGYMRVGEVGSFKDNIGSGGFACPIMEDGTLARFASNGTRKRFNEINGVNLENSTFKIPNFEKVLQMAFDAAECNQMNRVLSFDLILDKENQPHIIEFNLKAQTITTMQCMYKPFFGEYTDEVIEYCAKKIRNGNNPILPYYFKFIK